LEPDKEQGMHNSVKRPGERPVTVVFVALLLAAAIAVAAVATAKAAQFKMVACAATSGAPPYTTETNTGSVQHPGGIFDFSNYCGGAGGDPPGDSAFLRISEHEPSGNAGYGSYGRFVFATPNYVHFLTGGAYTREPNAFNAGWLARFRVNDFSGHQTTTLNQGAGLPNSGVDYATTGSFAPHLWPFGSAIDSNLFFYELVCNLPGGCDRANFNAVDANAFVFILNDDEKPDLYFLGQNTDLLQGKWVSGPQWTPWYIHDNGSGIRNERIRIDGAERYTIDHQALGQCNATSSQANGEFSRNFQPCPQGPYWHEWTLDTASLADGAHTLQVCGQDYGQYRGLNNTGGETCDGRTIHVDNHAPGAPAGLQVTSADPNRYLDHFGASFSLPPDPGSPIAKVHYEVVDAAGDALGSEQTISATNPTEITGVAGPAQAGEYRLKAWLQDSVGLVGPPATAPIPHDTTPPAAPQDISVTAPARSRATDGFDVRWRDIADAGSPIDEAHYRVLGGSGEIVVPTTAISGGEPQSIPDLDTPRGRGSFTLQLWLSDAEGNVGAPASVPLSYGCVRSDAAAGSSLSAFVSADGKRSVEVAQETGAPLNGKLLDANGHGVTSAPLCIFGRVITDAEPQFLGVAITGADGGYSFAISPGPSRELTATYRSGHREVSATATVATRVKPSFAVRRKVVRNKGVATFEGWIPGPHNDRVTVVLQVKRGKGWLAFHRYRTRGDGHFTVSYRFNRTTRPTLYLMRAQVRETQGYPYLQGTSDPLRLVVLPARHGPLRDRLGPHDRHHGFPLAH
jgi:hypothetical protein